MLVIDIADVLCMVHVVPNFTKEGHCKTNRYKFGRILNGDPVCSTIICCLLILHSIYVLCFFTTLKQVSTKVGFALPRYSFLSPRMVLLLK